MVTCLTDTFYPRAGIAAVKVLERLGCRVHFPLGQTCCGQPMSNNGFLADAADLARRTIDLFEPFEHVVTPSGSCAATVHEHYPRLLADDRRYADKARSLAGRIVEFSRFLADVLKVDLRAMGARWDGWVTYHYACHQRGIGVASPILPIQKQPEPGAAERSDTVRPGSPFAPQADPSVRLLQQIEGLAYVQLPRADQCCGFGGTFATKMPAISGELARDKLRAIEATGVPTCVSNEGGCTMNLEGAASRGGQAVTFITVAEILAEGLGLLPRGIGSQR